MLQCNINLLILKEFGGMKHKLLLLVGSMLLTNLALAAPVNIVAAENFYGQLAKEIGGNQVKVQSIMSNPDADPHLFTTSPSTSKALSGAQIIVYNGANYDDWMKQLLANIDKNKVIIINVADLMQVKDGQNPHIWYKPDTFPQLAQVLATKIQQLNPEAKKEVTTNLQKFIVANQQIRNLVAENKKRNKGKSVTATEPVFGYMSDALGLKMEGLDFQWKIMNDTEPTPKMIANYQSLLTNKKVKVLFYNSQVSDSITKNMQDLARQNGIPVVGVTETMPANVTINQWLNNELTATAAALAKSR